MSAPESATLVVVPTYDEVDSLPVLLRRLRAVHPELPVLVVDDASPDGTGQLADRLAANDEHLWVLHRAGKEGLGPAYIAGFRWAARNGYDYVVEMDADGSHQPEQLAALLAAAAPDVLVLGSRWVPGGGTRDWPWHRQLLSRSASWYSRTLLGLRTRDLTAGYRVIPVALLNEISLDSVESHGYCFQIDVLRRVAAAGHAVVEVPITFVERTAGRSKMDLPIVLEAMRRVTAWGVSARLGRG